MTDDGGCVLMVDNNFIAILAPPPPKKKYLYCITEKNNCIRSYQYRMTIETLFVTDYPQEN